MDVILVSSSGGKDRQVMESHIVRPATDSGVVHRIVVVHRALGEVEWLGCLPRLAA